MKKNVGVFHAMLVLILVIIILFIIIYFLSLEVLCGVVLRRMAWQCAMRKVFVPTLKRWYHASENIASDDSKNYSYRISFGVYSRSGVRGGSAIYWDAPYGIILRKDNIDVACIGFNILNKASRVMVTQIQGVKGMNHRLEHLRWERMLLECIVASAARMRFREVVVIPASKNRWCKDADKYNPPRLKKFQLRYDVTAKRSGFVWNKDQEHYVLPLCFVDKL